MKRYLLTGGALGVLLAATLAGCNNDGTTVPPAKPSPPATVDFETFTYNQVHEATCETLAETEIDGLDFTFPVDEDTSDAQDVSKVSPACTAS